MEEKLNKVLENFKEKSFIPERTPSILTGFSGYQNGQNINYFQGMNNLGYARKNPVVENLYNRIATDASICEIKLYKKSTKMQKRVIPSVSGSQVTIQEVDEEMPDWDDEYNKDLQYIIANRPNPIMNASAFYRAFFYQVVKFGNGIIFINKDPLTDKVISLDLIDVEKFEFGYGYENAENINPGKSQEYKLILRNRITGQEQKLDYKDIIHVRSKSQNITYGDYHELNNYTSILEIYNRNIFSILEKTNSETNIKGVLQLKGALGGEEEKRNKAKSFYKTMVTDGNGIAVLDEGEGFTPMTKNISDFNDNSLDFFTNFLYNMFGISKSIIEGTYKLEDYGAYFTNTLRPLLQDLEEEFNYKLLSENERKSNVVINITKPLLSSLTGTELMQIFQQGVYNGIINPNEARQIIGMKPIPQGERYYSNLNAVDLGSADAPTAPNSIQTQAITTNSVEGLQNVENFTTEPDAMSTDGSNNTDNSNNSSNTDNVNSKENNVDKSNNDTNNVDNKDNKDNTNNTDSKSSNTDNKDSKDNKNSKKKQK